jgi:acetoin utilization deacetylase AcuC-like enzyme
MKLVYAPQCLKYHDPGHPDCPERVHRAYAYLKDKYPSVQPKPASDEDLLKVHTLSHLLKIRANDFHEPDCPNFPEIDTYARLAAGAALLAAKERAFSLVRPPGHHAARDRIAGFCYYNNLALAIKTTHKKTLIIDFDGHHGDGTQEIFCGDEQVVFISLHRSPWYPGTGLKHIENCFNYPLAAFCGDRTYLETLDRALQSVYLDDVEQVAISAGFDAYIDDPLASLGLTTACFREIGRKIRLLKRPTFAVLEGGYHVEQLGLNIDAFLQGLGN